MSLVDIEGKTVGELRVLNWRRLVRLDDIPEYLIWRAMRDRCNNPNHACYRDYGGRGISVCPEWRADFWAWFKHIGRRPIAGLTLERIDNDKGYEPANVRWATYKAQRNNQRPPIMPGKTSRYHGVAWCNREKKWRARITINPNGERLAAKAFCIELGYFANQTDAAICWNYHCAYYGLPKELNVIRAEDYIH